MSRKGPKYKVKHFRLTVWNRRKFDRLMASGEWEIISRTGGGFGTATEYTLRKLLA